MSETDKETHTMISTIAKAVALGGGAIVGGAMQRAAVSAVAYLSAAVLFGISLCFITFAAYRALSERIGETGASLIVGCAFLFAGLVALLVLQSRRR